MREQGAGREKLLEPEKLPLLVRKVNKRRIV
jgi:hypothetical protein